MHIKMERALCILLHIFWLPIYIKCDWIENKGLWYYISPVGQSAKYTQATVICNSMNSRLAVITNQDQNDYIENIILDEEPRWIGLSNNKSLDHQANYECNDKNYVWNYDIFCKNNYSNFEKKQDPQQSSNCMGFTLTQNGKWSAEYCHNNYGFICQWECKRIYMQFSSLHEYNGTYMLHHYWDGNMVYIKTDADNYIDISKVKLDGKFTWILKEPRGEALSTIATYESDSYVPYDELMFWKIANSNTNIDSGSFCIDCDRMSLCIDIQNKEFIHFNELYLNTELLLYNTAVSYKGTVIIQYNQAQLTTCIDVSIIDNGNTHTSNIHVCAYIFPYPDQITRIDANATYVFYVQNKCVSPDTTCPIAQITTSWDELSQTSQTTSPYDTTSSFPEELKNDYEIVIAVTVCVIVMTGIVVAVCISYFVVQRRRRNNQHDKTHQDKHTYYNDSTRPMEDPSDDPANSEHSDKGVYYQNDGIARNGSISSIESVGRHGEKRGYYENGNIPRDENSPADEVGDVRVDQIVYYKNCNAHYNANPSNGQVGNGKMSVKYQNAGVHIAEDTSNSHDDSKPNYQYVGYHNDVSAITELKVQDRYEQLDRPASCQIPYETIRQ